MKRINLILILFLLLSCQQQNDWNVMNNKHVAMELDTNYFVPGVVRVKFKHAPDPSKFVTVHSQRVALQGLLVKEIKPVFHIGGRFEKRQRLAGLDRWYDVVLEESNMPQTKSFCSDLVKQSDIEKAYIIPKIYTGYEDVSYQYYDKIATNSANINDPLFSQQWHMDQGDIEAVPYSHINLREAWKHTAGRSDVIVAINDGGVDYNHVDLIDNIWINRGEIPDNGIDDDNNGYIDDVYGVNTITFGPILPSKHGTHVAGTVAAVTNNGVGVVGVAGGTGKGDGIKLMCIESVGGTSEHAMQNAFIYAADHGAVISQNSWGYRDQGFYEEAVFEAIDYFVKYAGCDENGNQIGPMKGGVVICSAGNNDTFGKHYPSSYEPCISVASTNIFRKKSGFSNYDSTVDISAPGGTTVDKTNEYSNVLSTFPYNEYGYMSGTSMATPHVSGIAALIVSKFGGPGFTNEMLKYRLLNAVHPLNDTEPDYAKFMGSGLVDAAKALVDYNDDVLAPELTSVKVQNENIEIQWKRSEMTDGKPAVKYYIYVSKNEITSQNVSQITPIEFDASSDSEVELCYTITDVDLNAECFFRMIGQDGYGNKSALSNQICYVALAPTEISVVPQQINKIATFRWGKGFNSNATLEIFSLNGKKIYKQNLSGYPNMIEIDLSFLASGNYTVVITDGAEQGKRQIIKL